MVSGLGSEKGDSLRETIIIYSDAYRQLFQSGNRFKMDRKLSTMHEV